jgi:hypothetical protein
LNVSSGFAVAGLLSIAHLAAANGVVDTVSQVSVGADVTLGPLNITTTATPSATSGGRSVAIAVGDNTGNREFRIDGAPLKLNTISGAGVICGAGLTVSGILALTTQVTGAATGDIVLQSVSYLRSVNNAGTGTFGLIRANGDRVQVAETVPLMVGTPSVTASATAGEVVLANIKAIRSVNAAGTDTKRLIVALATDYIHVAPDETIVKIPFTANASLPSGASQANGGIAVDSTNNRLVYYVGSLRYYLPIGTLF